MNDSEFDNVNIFTGEMPVKVPAQSGLVAVEQSRAMAEVQAAILMARMNPRDEYTAYERIKKACRRKSLAASATYAYPRGGKMVTGPTIRLAEVLASHWGNMTYGLKELSRKAGSSEIEAFAWDLETNVRAVRTFVVNHIRDKQSGNVALTSERDVYELVANMGQRRVRACILELIPGDIVEAAESQCRETLLKDEKPLEDRVREMVVVFSDLGVTKEMIEKRLGHKLKGIIPTQLVQLTQIYKSLKDGIAKREDFFTFDQTGKEQDESVDDRFHKEFIHHKHAATVEKINEGVKVLSEKFDVSEEEIKKTALEDPDAFRVELKGLENKGTTTPPEIPKDSAGETSAPKNETKEPPLEEGDGLPSDFGENPDPMTEDEKHRASARDLMMSLSSRASDKDLSEAIDNLKKPGGYLNKFPQKYQDEILSHCDRLLKELAKKEPEDNPQQVNNLKRFIDQCQDKLEALEQVKKNNRSTLSDHDWKELVKYADSAK